MSVPFDVPNSRKPFLSSLLVHRERSAVSKATVWKAACIHEKT